MLESLFAATAMCFDSMKIFTNCVDPECTGSVSL